MASFGLKQLSLGTCAVGAALALAPMATASRAQDAGAGERPNILWLTIEDISPYAFGCYGNTQVHTPTIDRLAREGIRFTQARATAPYCSPARASIISGNHATHYGADWHRFEVAVPQDRFFFPPHLRRAGYFVTNNEKTDYNALMNWADVWDACDDHATYNDPRRRPDQPFFAVFNNLSTHMSRLTTITLEGRAPLRLDPAKLDLPPHVPDLPTIRADFALHLEGAEDIDQWVALHLAELETRGLADNTIIFFFSDHGGCLPRGKAFPYETGYHVPMIVWAPEKWRDRIGIGSGKASDRLVGFEDLAPTVLSLVGIAPPPHMLGMAFLGEFARPPKAYQVGFRTNRAMTHFQPARTITDGRFSYIRHFTPYKPQGSYQAYKWQMPSQLAWQEAYLKKELSPEFTRFYLPMPAEELFDLENDPWEIHNLADDPQYAGLLTTLRGRLREWMRETADLGLFPHPSRWNGKDPDIHTWVRETNYPLEALQDAAWMASETHAADAPQLIALLQDPRVEMRFWGAAGFATRAQAGTLDAVLQALVDAMQDSDALVASTAAKAIHVFDKRPEALERLITLAVEENEVPAYVALMDITLVEGRTDRLSEALREVDNYNARGVRINMGDLPMSRLYPHEIIPARLEIYRDRLNWRKHLP